MEKEVVIKSTFRGSFKNMVFKILMIIGIAAFIPVGIWLFLNSDGIFDMVLAFAAIAGSGFGLYAVISDAINGTTIATISNKGIAIPDTPFISWENLSKFEILENDLITRQVLNSRDTYITIEYMSISDDNGQTEMRSMKIDPSFSNYTLDETMEILKNFHDGYTSSKSKA
jgi:hypothetical protein